MTRTFLTRVLAIFALVALAGFAAACRPGLGERCNPLRFTDDCPTGTACTYPPSCGVAYCCPTAPLSDPAGTPIPSCMACAAADAGTADDGGGAGAGD